ncbi:alkylation response protein AidB-like acyl-CoA dehydrogenase [Desulfosalsimonas propionicica]|uniref:Alkylation response protein AidB-like acyl-CoA dehydrogenase n=1 Tax=Desulfosalsimonas propionicica TaxID=332175 RepID=A0A7W0CC71_9BACT|nr:acyl-CoA dehydrogenase family protein [Desulfosalsimonas propionicica]MBA2882984.1 alkylation response protein AidB-like acyl-CoA dehydrogenase [Desulfosalsimonas propionicica]
MDFRLSREQEMFRKSVEEFARKEILPDVNERAAKTGFSAEIWKKIADYGLTGLSIPEAYGGDGADATTTVTAMTALTRASGDIGLSVVWGSHMLLTAMPIADLGTKEQKEKYLPRMAKGEWIGGFALTESDAGSDATGLQTTAENKGDFYLVNGSKTFISNAPIADVFVVFASTDISNRAGGISLFIVEKDTPGLQIGKPLEKYGNHDSPTGELFFDNCRVPSKNLLGQENGGFEAMLFSLGWERLAFAPYIGIMEFDLKMSIEYAKTRKQFGRPIGKFQLVQAMLAEMKMDIEASRLLVYQLAWKKDKGEDISMDAAIAKTFITEAAYRVADKAVQIHGGNGCMVEYPVGRSLWGAKMGTIGGGTSQMQRTIISRFLTGL